jgi:hypothetical protein
MKPDTLDAIARQAATSTMSRRATLKAAAGAMLAAAFLEGTRRPSPGGNHALALVPLAEASPALADDESSPDCNWSGAAAACAGALAQLFSCVASCSVKTTACGCLVTVQNQVEKCLKGLHCNCASGQYCASGWGLMGTCCESPEQCIDPYGCVPPCGPCEERSALLAVCESKCKDSASQDCCENTCTDLATDPGNCGECGYACNSDQTCEDGECTPPECDPPCKDGQTCQDDQCICPGGNPACDGQCPDLQTDPNNCGSCGNVCPGSTTCASGGCTCGTPCDASSCLTCDYSTGQCVSTATDPYTSCCPGPVDGTPYDPSTTMCCGPGATSGHTCPTGTACCGTEACCTSPQVCTNATNSTCG